MLIFSKDSFEIDGAEQVSSIKPSHPRTSQKKRTHISTHAWLVAPASVLVMEPCNLQEA